VRDVEDLDVIGGVQDRAQVRADQRVVVDHHDAWLQIWLHKTRKGPLR
jgi:hypothetical protein